LNFRWHDLYHGGIHPRAAHSAVYIPEADSLYVFGGYDLNNILGDLVVFRFNTSMWYDQNDNIIGNIFILFNKSIMYVCNMYILNMYTYIYFYSYSIDPIHTTVNSIGSTTINALMTAKLGDQTIVTNKSKYPFSNNSSHVNQHKQNKPWSAVLHDIFVSLADDSTFLEHQNDVIIFIIYIL